MSTPASILLLLICGIAAFWLVNWLWPIFEQRKQLTPEQMAKLALQEAAERTQRQATKFGSKTRTLVVILLNAALLSLWLWASNHVPDLLWLGFAYLAIGFIVQGLAKVPAANELADLNFADRFWLRIFYAWFWPAFLPYIRRRK